MPRPNQNIRTALIQMWISLHFATVKFQIHIFFVCYSLHLKHSQLFHEVMFDLSMNFFLLIFSNGPYTGSVGVHLFMNCYVLAWVSVWSFCNLMQSGFWGYFSPEWEARPSAASPKGPLRERVGWLHYAVTDRNSHTNTFLRCHCDIFFAHMVWSMWSVKATLTWLQWDYLSLMASSVFSPAV